MLSFIIKVLCILLANVGIHKSFTAPHMPSEGEVLPITRPLDWFVMMIIRYMGAIKSIFWMVGLAEVATLCANAWPSSVFSAWVISKLVVRGDVNNIRLTPLSATGILLISLGTLLRIRCYRELKTLFTFDVTIRKDHKLVSTGPYGVVRHPSYSGILMVYFGMACWYGSSGSWLRESGVLDTRGGQLFFGVFGAIMGMTPVGLLHRMSIEDGALRERFGVKWFEYAQKVPYSIVPGLY